MAWGRLSRRQRIVVGGGVGLLLVALLAALVANDVLPALRSTNNGAVGSGASLTVDAAGTYSVRFARPAWTFSGAAPRRPTDLAADAGHDAIGAYREIRFTVGTQRDAIRTYINEPVVLFTMTYTAASANDDSFPRITNYPRLPYHLSYHGAFGVYAMNQLGTDSPWLFFDGHDDAFLLSPAANFLIARSHLSAGNALVSGIDSRIPQVPSGFAHSVILVAGSGIGSIYNLWGHALTALHGKVRPANDATPELRSLGYWTDNGAAYYYHDVPPLGYRGTLLAVVHEFQAKGIPLGYLELDSWWYLKGDPPSWQNRSDGIYAYSADPVLFPQGLPAFQQQVGLPLITHARWLDPRSPYRTQYRVSNNVAVDPAYWAAVASYLKGAGVITYEQDWLSSYASTAFDLNDPSAYLNEMAGAMRADGLTLQYCSPLPEDYLQASEYSDVTTMRVSVDHFMRSRWDEFLYDSQLAAAVGVWPWSDVFQSGETTNLLLSNLSAGMVGVGDPLGAEKVANLERVIRADGVIVKPDAPIVPSDVTYIAEAASGPTVPMVASTYSDHEGMRAAYVFAYARGGSDRVSFSPAALGIAGKAYVYNYFTGAGALVAPGETFSDTVTRDGSYYIVVPVGTSGIAFLGDAGKFVSLGRQRISALSDDGVVHATITFAPGDIGVTLHGYAPVMPNVSVNGAGSSKLVMSYDATTHLFSIRITGEIAGNVELTLTPGR